ncbi:MAG: hypothetical protein AB7H92_04065 [Microbacteriaceae bacterium]
MAAFKDEIGVDLVRRLAVELAAAWPAFPRQRFQRGITAELERLELLARVDALAGRLAGSLPQRFDDAATVLWAALASPSFTGWMTLPCGTFVAQRGLDHPAIALPLLAGLTPRWSSEGPIRPFIEHHPDLTYDHLRRWATDQDEHVRRLVSEGTRPRLPWAPLLRGLIADPSPNLPLLEQLVDDPSPYVRRGQRRRPVTLIATPAKWSHVKGRQFTNMRRSVHTRGRPNNRTTTRGSPPRRSGPA